MKHLTHTGPNAGQPLCGAARCGRGGYLHAAYAPLHEADVRAAVCKGCLATWLAFAFEGEPLPDWPSTPEEIAAIEAAIPAAYATDAEVAEFRAKLRREKCGVTAISQEIAERLGVPCRIPDVADAVAKLRAE